MVAFVSLHLLCGRVVYSQPTLPNGVFRSDARTMTDEKHAYVEHAERSAIFEAARLGLKTQGATMILSGKQNYPCAECARAIIMAGVATVIVGDCPETDAENALYKYDAARRMFDESGVLLLSPAAHLIS